MGEIARTVFTPYAGYTESILGEWHPSSSRKSQLKPGGRILKKRKKINLFITSPRGFSGDILEHGKGDERGRVAPQENATNLATGVEHLLIDTANKQEASQYNYWSGDEQNMLIQ